MVRVRHNGFGTIVALNVTGLMANSVGDAKSVAHEVRYRSQGGRLQGRLATRVHGTDHSRWSDDAVSLAVLKEMGSTGARCVRGPESGCDRSLLDWAGGSGTVNGRESKYT